MISSVIAKLRPGADGQNRTLDAIAAHRGFEMGELVDNRLLPITIDASGVEDMEIETRWLQGLEGVEFVDVVFVHFEND